MRIAIPTDNDQTIAAHTGRCQGFAIYDIDNGEAKKVEYRANNMTQHGYSHGQNESGGRQCSHQGHGHGEGNQAHSHNRLLDALDDCQMMVAKGMGPRLVQDLQQHGIEVCFSMENDVRKAAESLAKGELQANPRGSSCTRGC